MPMRLARKFEPTKTRSGSASVNFLSKGGARDALGISHAQCRCGWPENSSRPKPAVDPLRSIFFLKAVRETRWASLMHNADAAGPKIRADQNPQWIRFGQFS